MISHVKGTRERTHMPPVFVRGQPLRAAKRFLDGTHRCATPEETFQRIQPYLCTAGITRLADITGLDRIGVHTIIAYRPNGRTLASAAGKGFSLVAAQVSAAMEGIELHHAENLRMAALHASYENLAASGPVVALEQLPLTRRSMFRPDQREYWVRSWDLLRQEEVPLPHASVAMTRHASQKPRYALPFVLDSNGLASGNHLLEAACAGLLEVIERDAVSCHMLARHRVGHQFPKVRPETIEHPRVLDLFDRIRAARLETLVYDCSVDTEVPVYLAYLFDRETRQVGIAAGFGAHLDPEVAMIRAITEAVQGRLVYISGARDDVFREDDVKFKANDNAETLARFEAEPATVDARERRSEATASFEGDLTTLLAKLRQVGIDRVLLCDLSHEEIGIPVVRVTVPGLEGYASRLYTAGRRATAFCEARACVR